RTLVSAQPAPAGAEPLGLLVHRPRERLQRAHKRLDRHGLPSRDYRRLPAVDWESQASLENAIVQYHRDFPSSRRALACAGYPPQSAGRRSERLLLVLFHQRADLPLLEQTDSPRLRQGAPSDLLGTHPRLGLPMDVVRREESEAGAFALDKMASG